MDPGLDAFARAWMALPADLPPFAAVHAGVAMARGCTVWTPDGRPARVTAAVSAGRDALVAQFATGNVVLHADCWGRPYTCVGTWAGGLYLGPGSLCAWFLERRPGGAPRGRRRRRIPG